MSVAVLHFYLSLTFFGQSKEPTLKRDCWDNSVVNKAPASEINLLHAGPVKLEHLPLTCLSNLVHNTLAYKLVTGKF